MRVLDGDTFEARVPVWPGMQITTRVRLRGIDAPELRARCDDEREKALAAREALARLLAQGAVGIARVGQDKYGGRVDADVSTAGTHDVSAAMLQGGFARPLFRRTARELVRVTGARRCAGKPLPFDDHRRADIDQR